MLQSSGTVEVQTAATNLLAMYQKRMALGRHIHGQNTVFYLFDYSFFHFDYNIQMKNFNIDYARRIIYN